MAAVLTATTVEPLTDERAPAFLDALECSYQEGGE